MKRPQQMHPNRDTQMKKADSLAARPSHYAKIFAGALACLAIQNAKAAIGNRIYVADAPTPFSAVAPSGWARKATNSRNVHLVIEFPATQSSASCGINIIQMPSLRGLSQALLDQSTLADHGDESLRKSLSINYDNVRIIASGQTVLSGYPAVARKIQFESGPLGARRWYVSTSSTSLLEPGNSFTVMCYASGSTLLDAQRGFAYWKSTFVVFMASVEFTK
jgi:hypothetical protein